VSSSVFWAQVSGLCFLSALMPSPSVYSRDKGEIGEDGGLNAGLGGFAGGVHHHKVKTLLRHGWQNVLKPGGHTGYDLRIFALSPVAPVGGGRLLVKVNHKRLVLGLGGEDGEGQASVVLPLPPFCPMTAIFSML
jgi:hypothetical protein